MYSPMGMLYLEQKLEIDSNIPKIARRVVPSSKLPISSYYLVRKRQIFFQLTM